MSGNKLTLSQILSGVFCMMVLLVALEVPQVQGQITFSKDWRAGGKRANTLSANGVSVLDVPCDQLASWSNTQIRDLVRVSRKELTVQSVNN